MESGYLLINMWAHAVEQAGSSNVDAVRQALIGQAMHSPSGYDVEMGKNHFISKPLIIGEIRADGQFDIVYQTKNAIAPKAWSPYLASDAGKVADWTYPWVCGGCEKPRFD